MAGLERDLHALHGGLSHPSTIRAAAGGGPGDRLLSEELTHVVQPHGGGHGAALQDHGTSEEVDGTVPAAHVGRLRPGAGWIGPADDEYEREAHAVATNVVRGLSSPGVGTPALGPGHGVQRVCASCSAGHGCPDEHGSGSNGCAEPGGSPSADVLQRLVGSPPAGSAVPEDVRFAVEPALGADLSGVRVHSDPVSHRVARDIGARAFTHRDHVFLGAGESAQDVAVMAHELTHTVQQGATPARAAAWPVQRWPSLDDVADFVVDAAESGRDAAASAVGAVGDAVDTAEEALGDAADAVSETLSDVGEAVYDFGAGAVEAAGDALGWLKTEAGQALSAIADFLGGWISITDEGLVLTVPGVCIQDPLVLSFTLPPISGEAMIPIAGLPLGPVVLVGEIGIAGTLQPAAEVQLGPFCLSGVRIAVNPFSASSSIGGKLSAAAAVSIGSQVRGGLRGELSLVGLIPIGAIAVPISVPLIGLEGGLAGLFRGIAAGQLTFGGQLGFDLGGISLNQGAVLDLGFGADMFLGAYGQLDILGQNVCRIYWQPVEWHGDIGGSVGIDLSMSLAPGGVPLISPVLRPPVLTDSPFDQIHLAVSRKGFADDCPIKDSICAVLRTLGLLPSQNGGVWDWNGPYGPGPRLPGPLLCYRRDPGIPSAARCRGACGENCDTCASTPTRTVTDPATGDTWIYANFQACNSNGGCRDHDAAFDWAADKQGEIGEWAILMPWHMAANIECACNNLAGDCIAWIAGLPPFDMSIFYADSATRVGSGGGGSLTTDCRAEFPSASDCVVGLPDRDSFLAAWGQPKDVTDFRDFRVVEEFRAAAGSACAGAPGRAWRCTATDAPSGRALTVSLTECICCNEDGTSGSEWRDPAVLIDGGMSEEFILDLCERRLVPRVICLPLEEDMIARFGRRRDPNVDPDEDPKTVLRPDDVPIFESFRRMYNRLDSWSIFIPANHEDLVPEFVARFGLEGRRKAWLAALKERATTFKGQFRNLRDTDPGRARREYEDAVLGGIEAEITATVRDIADWFKARTGSTEPIGELLQRVHEAGTELWREAWRRASLQVNRVLARLWPPARTQILVWVGEKRRERPDLDLRGTVGELDYIGSLATGFKGPPKQQIRFNPQKFDVDANLAAPPLAKYAIAVNRQIPDRERIFGRRTDIRPLNEFSDRTQTELVARVTGYDNDPAEPFDVAIDAPELPTQTRQRKATERLFRLRESLATATYQQMLDEIIARGFLGSLGGVREDLTEAEFLELEAIIDRFDPTAPRHP